MARGPDEWVKGMLSRLPRQEPPSSVSLEEILERGRRQHQRRLLVGGGVAAVLAGLLALSALLTGSEGPPVHLDLKVVDVPHEPAVDIQPETASWMAFPREAQGP